MEIYKINPQGFCGGVRNAISLSLSLTSNKNTYCLGSLIHNKIMTDRLSEKGIITVDKKGLSRLELLDFIPNNSTVILSAHGVSFKVLLKAKSKNLNIIDATCPFVKKTHDEIVKYLNLGYDVYYIGVKGHAECEGALGIDNNIKLITSIDDVMTYDFKNKSFIINQTTTSFYDIKDIHNKILEINPNVLISNSICNATTKRQEAVLNAPSCDLFIVVGDTKSSNTTKLYMLASKKFKSIMINDVSDIKNYNFNGIDKINITSGASTPPDVVDDVINFLKKYQKKENY